MEARHYPAAFHRARPVGLIRAARMGGASALRAVLVNLAMLPVYVALLFTAISAGAVVGGIFAAGKLPEYREWTESLDYLDVLRLLDVSFSLGAIRGERVFGRIQDIVGDVDIENLNIPFTAVATDLTNQQEIWFQEGCLHQAMRASAAIPSLFTPVIQGKRMLVDGGLLNPLPIVPVVSSHCDLIVAVNLNATNQNHYQLPLIERPADRKSVV